MYMTYIQVILIMMHVVVFSGDGVALAKPELASAAQVHYLSLIQRWDIIPITIAITSTIAIAQVHYLSLIQR